MRNLITFAILLCLALQAIAQEKRLIRPEDLFRMKSISSPKLSPDGQWIMYSLSKADSAKDRYESKLYMMSTDGKETIQLTDERSAGSPAWSPDNAYISFLSKSKVEAEPSQLFLMNRKGGEPMQLTHIKGEIFRYKWFEDGKRILLEIRDPNTADTAKTKIRKPYEIDRFHFKDDADGYLDNRKVHLYVFDLHTKKLDTLTRGEKNETNATITRDGQFIAYVSNVTLDPDRNANTDIFLMNVISRKTEQITHYPGSDNNPEFSPDGTHLSFNRSTGQGNFTMYELSELHLYSISSKSITNISSSLDRSIEETSWSPDSKFIYALIENDRKQNIISFDLQNNKTTWTTDQTGVYA